MRKVLNKLRRRVDEHSENFNKENVEKNHTELKNTITEMKTTLEGIHNRLDDTEEQIANWKTVVEITQDEQKKELKEMRIV